MGNQTARWGGGDRGGRVDTPTAGRGPVGAWTRRPAGRAAMAPNPDMGYPAVSSVVSADLL